MSDFKAFYRKDGRQYVYRELIDFMGEELPGMKRNPIFVDVMLQIITIADGMSHRLDNL